MVRAFGTSGRPCFFSLHDPRGLENVAQASGRSYLGDNSDNLGRGAS